MNKYTDYFHLLDVDLDTGKEGIKKAFMTKALLFHPDKAKTAAEKKSFTKIYEDYKQLYDKSYRTLQRKIRDLEKSGLVTIKEKTTKQGGKTSSLSLASKKLTDF